MTYTILPSLKGQVTLPINIRKKYHISKNTPIKVVDNGNGCIQLKVMYLVNDRDIEYSENEKEASITFKKGIDAQTIISKIQKINQSESWLDSHFNKWKGAESPEKIITKIDQSQKDADFDNINLA